MLKNINEIPIKVTPVQSDKIIGFDNETGEAISVAISAIVTQGSDGQSLEVQYSQDGETWHYPSEATDIYMRQRLGSASWGAVTRINVPDSTLAEIRENIEVDFTEQLQDAATAQEAYTDAAIAVTEANVANQLQNATTAQEAYTDNAISDSEATIAKQLDKASAAQKKYTDDAIAITEANVANKIQDATTAQEAYTDDAIQKVKRSSYVDQQISDDSFANDQSIGVFFFQGFKAYKFKGDIIYSENLILTSNIDPMHGYGEQTYKWITSNNTWRIIGRIKKGAEWGSWIEYNTNP